jgi:hypothetical protein
MKDQLHRSAALLISSGFVTTGVGLAMYALGQEGPRAAVFALCAVALLVAAALGLGRRIAEWRLRSGRGLGFITVWLILAPLILAGAIAIYAAFTWILVLWMLQRTPHFYLALVLSTVGSAAYLAMAIYNAVKLLGARRRPG